MCAYPTISQIITIRLTVISRAHNEHERHVTKVDRLLGTIIDHLNMCIADPERRQTPLMLFQWHRGICTGLRRWLNRDIPIRLFQQFGSPFETIKNLTVAMSADQSKKFARMCGTDFTEEVGEMMFPAGGRAYEALADSSDEGMMDFSVTDPMRDVIFDSSFYINLMWSFPVGGQSE